jgi:peroxiredoxin
MSTLREGEPVPKPLADADVIDSTGARVRLESLWRGRACVVLFLRHFGCIGCAGFVAELGPRLDELVRVGVHVVLVGNGTREQMAAFRERNALLDARVDLVTDPTLTVHRAAGLQRSIWSTFGPRSMIEHARLWAAGLGNRSVEGDATQQGGAMLVDARGIVRLARRDRSIGDHVSASQLVDAALGLAIEARADVHV